VAKNMQNLLRQAQQMQQKISVLQKELETREIDVSAGGGAVTIKINGKQQISAIKISKDLIQSQDQEMIQEVLMTGINQAIKESQEMVNSAMSKVTGGMNIPGLF
jgi:DNA-binding YbaB/EbfC family protein